MFLSSTLPSTRPTTALERRPSRSTRPPTEHTLALVLAGGRGSRLQQLTERVAKPALPFGGEPRLIDFPLSNCINSGIRRVAVLTQYKAQSLIRHVERAWGFLSPQLSEYVDVVPAQQQLGELWYRGTADAVFQNLDLVRDAGAEWVLVLAGDHVYRMDYGRMLADHVARGAAASVACIEVPLGAASEFGIVAVDADRRIVRFDEKPQRPMPRPGSVDRALASMGVYVFDAGLLCEHLAQAAPEAPEGLDFARDVIPALLGEHRVFAHDFGDSCLDGGDGQAYWRDVGTLDAYWEANIDLTGTTPGVDLHDASWPILGLHPPSPPARFVDAAHAGPSAVLDAVVSGGCVVRGAQVHRSVLYPGVQVGEGSRVEESVLLPGVTVGRRVRLRRTIVDSGCALPDGFSAGVYAAEDRARFEVTAAGITLVTPDMLEGPGGSYPAR